MKYKKSMFIVMLAIFLFSIASVCASEMDTPMASEETDQLELSVNDEITVDSIQMSEDNDERVSAQTDSDGLSANAGNDSGISSEMCFEENLGSKQDNDYGTSETSSDGVVIEGTGTLSASAAKDSIPIAADKLQNNVIVRANNVTYGQETLIEITADVDGTYKVNIAGTVYDVNVIGGSGSKSIKLNAGMFKTNVTFDNDNYITNVQDARFSVYKADINIDIIVYDYETYPDEVECIVYASRDGEYNLTIGDYITVINVKDNIGYYEHTTLDAGTYQASVSFLGDKNYYQAFNITKFTVYPLGTLFEMEANPSQIFYGETSIITHTITDDATGTIEYYLNNGTFLGEKNVHENFILPVINSGSYVVIGKYSGDQNHIPATDSTFISVKPDNTFLALNSTINGNDNPVINLTHDYYFDPAYDADFVNGIVINRPVTINGNGYTIDAKSQARIFQVTGNDVALENMTFINGNTTGRGGAVYFSQLGRIINCNFTNNTAYVDGGAVYFLNEGAVENCNFTNNKATGEDGLGGAVWMYSGNVTNCNFINNQATGVWSCGGAIMFDWTGNVTNCNFTNNSASQDGGAVYFLNEGAVENCNFTDNEAYYGGAILFDGTGTVTNCNFTDNSAYRSGGAVWMDSGTVSNCNFTNNSASAWGGAIRMNSGNVANCNFTNNKATGEDGLGGAINMYSGTVSNCNFTNNSASRDGGAVYFYDSTVTNCNFAGNNAINGSAIYFYSTSDSKTVSNSRFLNNRANSEALEVTKNDNNITITFTGNDNLLNAIYSRDDAEVTFTNVAYWSANGIANTGSSETKPSKSNKEAGQNITVGVVVNDEIVFNKVLVTDEDGMIVLDISVGENYYISARHDTDSYYTEARKTISNNTKFNVNVTSQTTNNRTVNITASSNIPNEIIKGKLLFIVPDGTEINATYGTNGLWWAAYTFDDYGVYQINATFIGLDNVTVTNATITIVKQDSTITLDNITLNYGESKNITVTTEGATGITARINGSNVDVIDNYVIPISGLGAGNYTLTVTTIPDINHNPVTETADITVNKASTSINLGNETLDLKVSDMGTISANLTPADAGNLTYVSSNESVIQVSKGFFAAMGKGTAIITVSFAGNDNYTAAENKTISVTVTLNDASVSVENSTLDLKVDDTFDLNASTVPDYLNIQYNSSDESVARVSDYGIVTAVGEGTATITLTVGNNITFAVNSTVVTVNVKKIDTSIDVDANSLDLKVGENSSIQATLTPADAGNVTFTSSSSSVVSVDGKGNVRAVAAGKANITVSFAGDDKYFAADNKTIEVTVTPLDASVNVTKTFYELFIDEYDTIVATTVPEGLKVNFSTDDDDIISVDDAGKITALAEGDAVIFVSVGDNVVYKYDVVNVNVSVSKIPTEIALTNETFELHYGDSVRNFASLIPAEAGNLTFVSSNENVVLVANDDIFMLAYHIGTATVTVSFAGNDKYAAAENKTILVNVTLMDASVSVENATLDLKIGDRYDLDPTTVPHWMNVEYASSNESVVTVNTYGIVDAVGEGTATITLTVGENIMHAVNSTNVTVTVSKHDANVDVSMPENVTVGENSTVNVVLPSDATGNVTVKVDGEVADTVPVTDGTASLKLLELNAGNHTVETTYSGDGKYKSASKTATISVNKGSTNLAAADVTATYKVNKYLVITLKDSQGNPLANSTVAVELGAAKNYTTDENGQVKVKVSNMVPKAYTAKIAFAGNDNYLGSNATAKVVVKKATPKITAKAKTFKTTTKTKKYTITLKDKNGKGIRNAKVTLKVNGKTYNATTNSKGKATFKITKLNKKGTFKATITFKGSKYYKKVTKKVNIKVKSVWKTVSKGSKRTAIVKKIQRALKNHGYYLTYNGHYLKVDGIFWDYTKMAVKQFQNDKILKVTGKVDEKTAKKLGII